MTKCNAKTGTLQEQDIILLCRSEDERKLIDDVLSMNDEEVEVCLTAMRILRRFGSGSEEYNKLLTDMGKVNSLDSAKALVKKWETYTDSAAALVERMTAKVEKIRARSAWDKGVKIYAEELLENLAEAVAGGYESLATLTDHKAVKKALLNGAADWSQYSWGGSSLIYDGDIAERLCCPSELKKTRYGERRPNSQEEWLDTQARALYQACRWICATFECVRWYDDNGEPLPQF